MGLSTVTVSDTELPVSAILGRRRVTPPGCGSRAPIRSRTACWTISFVAQAPAGPSVTRTPAAPSWRSRVRRLSRNVWERSMIQSLARLRFRQIEFNLDKLVTTESQVGHFLIMSRENIGPDGNARVTVRTHRDEFCRGRLSSFEQHLSF